MAVVSVTVESSGWVLAVRGDWNSTTTGGAWTNGDRHDSRWSNGGIDQFPLTPGATPKLVVNVRDAGFDRVGGLPVANLSRPRTVVATKPLRRPWPHDGQLDEFDHGDGTRTVRFALSDRIYATSVVVSAAFLSGWKAGEGGGVVSTITNSSTRAAPLPIFRWARETLPLVRGSAGAPNHSLELDVICATHHPEHFGIELHQPLAAMEFLFFDNSGAPKSVMVTGLRTSPLYGDNLRCIGQAINLEPLGLSPGPITVHARAYPWIGAARETGNAHNTSTIASLGPAWGVPFQFYYDPVGATLTPRFIMLDNTAPNTDPNNAAHRSAITLYTDMASALAAPLANKAANSQVAQAALGSLNQTWTGRNGFVNVTRNAAYCELILTAGQVIETGGITYGSAGANAGVGYIVIRGDPTNADPRANCVFQAGSAAVQFGNTDRVKFRDCTVRIGNTNFFNLRANSWATFENVSMEGRPGELGGGGQIYNSIAHFSAFNSTFRDGNAQPTGWMMRNVVRTRANNTAACAVAINVTLAMPQAGDFAPPRTTFAFTGGTANPDDTMIWGCKVYGWAAGMLSTGSSTNFGDGGASRRFALVNTLYEMATNASFKEVLVIGESGSSQLQDSIFEGVTFVGGRFNWHNDAPFASMTSNVAAVRVNNSPNTTITIGLMNHGLAAGDSITVAGFINANMNRTTTVTAVLGPHRFQYAAAAAVTTVTADGRRDQMTTAGDTSGGPRVTINSGLLAGTTRFIIGLDLQQTGNVIRYSAMDRNATKHDSFSADGGLTGSWELLYGVGYHGNVNANRGAASPANFQYAFYGIGSEIELNFTGPATSPVASYGVNWFGYISDLSASGPGEPAGVGNGDYRADTITLSPFKPSRLLNKGNGPAVVDRDGGNLPRGATFDGGAMGRAGSLVAPLRLQPASGSSLQQVDATRIRWSGEVSPINAISATSSGAPVITMSTGTGPLPGNRRLLRVAPEGNGMAVEAE